MSPRRRGREVALQVLYQFDLCGGEPEDGLRAFADSFEANPRVRSFAWSLVRGIRERQTALDTLLAASSEHWRIERLSRIDSNVLRIAAYEMMCGLPPEIAISEAVEVARRYGASESGAFVNGVLDAVARRLGLLKGQSDTSNTD
jgi:N utilization substance protein B